MEVKVDVCVDKDMVTKIEKKKTIIDNVFGFNQEERNLLNHLFAIFLERIAVNETTYILLDKDSKKSELMFIYITCLYANYKSMGEADLTFSDVEEVRDEIFEFVYRLIDLLNDIPNDNKVHIASGEDGYYLVIS